MRFDEFDPGERANPFHGIGEATFYSVEQEHEPWPIDVRERFLAACDANLYFAFHLLLYLGQRVSDVCALKWSQYDGTRIQLTQIKTKKSNDPMRIRVPKNRSSRCTTRASPTKRCCPTKLPRSWTWWPHEKRTRRKPRPRRAAL